MRFSFSSISLFQRCPYAFRLKYIDLAEERYYAPFLHGKIAHYYMEIRARNDRTTTERLTVEKYPFDYTPAICKEVEGNVSEDTFSHTFRTEMKINFMLGEYQLTGIIDRLDLENDHYTIVDYKYGRYIYSQKDLLNSLQLKIYAYGIMSLKNVDVVRVVYHNLRQRHIVGMDIGRSDIDIATLQAYLTGMHTRMEARDLPAIPGLHCISCQYSHICEYFTQYMQSAGLSGKVDLTDLMDEYNKIKVIYQTTQQKKEFLESILSEYEGVDPRIKRNMKGEIKVETT
jgi:CRISPR/Cas system-associated exonuclease Cas4 (RecB family)